MPRLQNWFNGLNERQLVLVRVMTFIIGIPLTLLFGVGLLVIAVWLYLEFGKNEQPLNKNVMRLMLKEALKIIGVALLSLIIVGIANLLPTKLSEIRVIHWKNGNVSYPPEYSKMNIIDWDDKSGVAEIRGETSGKSGFEVIREGTYWIVDTPLKTGLLYTAFAIFWGYLAYLLIRFVIWRFIIWVVKTLKEVV